MKTMYVELSKESSEASGKVVATLTPEEKNQLFEYMRSGYKTVSDPVANIPGGLFAVADCELTRRVFNGFIRY